MDFYEFVERYDVFGSIVLLEGKRSVADCDIPMLEAVGEKLAKMTSKIIFRSGNAPGADFYFSKGIARINARRLQVIKPYSSHRFSEALTENQFSLDDVKEIDEDILIDKTRMNKKFESLMNYYQKNKTGSIAAKAKYILRDTLKVTGAGESIMKAAFALFYDDLNKPETGGTGHTMIICRQCGIPFADQQIWMKWL